MQIELKGIREAMDSLDPVKVQKAARQAINDVARQSRTAASKEIRAKWNLKAAKVNAEVKNTKFAQGGSFSATIQAKGRPISLAHFGAKQVTRKSKGRRVTKGATVQVLRGIKTSYPRAFMVRFINGHQAVVMNEKDFFGRSAYDYHTPSKGFYAGKRGRSGIVSLSTITIASMFNQPKVVKAIEDVVESKWPERFSHHLDRQLKR